MSAPPAPLAALYEVLGWILFTAGQYDASLAASERAAALARVGGDDGTRALAEAQRINLLQMLGRLGDALHVGQEALPLTEALGELECQWRVHIDLAYVHVLRGSWETSRGHLDRALAVAEQMGEPGQPAFARALRGWVASLEGDGARARSALETAVALSRHTEPSWYTPYPLIFRARVALIEGAWGEAAAQIQEALAVVERSGDLQAQRFAGGVTAEVDILEGRPEAASACLIPLLDRPGLEECDVTLLLPLLAWAYLEQGEVARAAQTLAQALARAGREEMRLALVDALRVQALVALRQERWDVAARSLAEGVAMAQQMPYPYAEARLLHVEGALQTRTGEPETARERLEGARAIFQRLGAHADVARVEQDLRMLSAAPSPGAAVRAVASARHGAVAPAPPGARRARMQRHAWAVEHLRTRGPLSPRAYAAAMTISVDTALRDLQELVDRGVVQAVGTTRDRRYVLVGKAVEAMIHRSAP